jgi:hypothetical protein
MLGYISSLAFLISTLLISSSVAFIHPLSVAGRKLTSYPKVRVQMNSIIEVKGDEGLLDVSRMDRAYKGLYQKHIHLILLLFITPRCATLGTGIKISADKKLKIGIIGSGLGGMITAMELAEAGHDVEIFESRRFYGGKVDKNSKFFTLVMPSYFAPIIFNSYRLDRGLTRIIITLKWVFMSSSVVIIIYLGS